MRTLLSLLAAGAAVVSMPTDAAAAEFDPNAYYRLTTTFQGECKSLDVVNDAKDDTVRLAVSDEVSGQFWKITPTKNGYYRLTTMFKGTGKSLDIVNDATDNTPWLATTEDVSGQHWKLTPLGDGTYRLTTMWQGAGKSLDIVNDAKDDTPILAPSTNASGQHWRITKESDVGPVPKYLGLSTFYKKYLDAEGIPIVASDKVPDKALYRVRFLTRQMLSRMAPVRKELQSLHVRIVVMADTEVTTDVPEFSHLTTTEDGRHYDETRGLGATVTIPVSSCAEENVLCYGNGKDPYFNEDIFVHEFGHTLDLAMRRTFGDFAEKLDTAWANAKSKKLWEGTYAGSNEREYFAEGVQSWFNLNAQAIPADGTHNYVNTRAELKKHDPELHALLQAYFPEDRNNCSCHPAAKPDFSAAPSTKTTIPRIRPRKTMIRVPKKKKLPFGKIGSD